MFIIAIITATLDMLLTYIYNTQVDYKMIGSKSIGAPTLGISGDKSLCEVIVINLV